MTKLGNPCLRELSNLSVKIQPSDIKRARSCRVRADSPWKESVGSGRDTGWNVGTPAEIFVALPRFSTLPLHHSPIGAFLRHLDEPLKTRGSHTGEFLL